MSLIVRPYTYIPGNVILAQFHEINEITLYNLVNGSITDENLGVVTEDAITFLSTGHEHGGGSDGAKIDLAQDPAPDSFLMKLDAQGDGNGLEALSSGSSRAGVKGTGQASDAYGIHADNNQAAGVGLFVEATGNGTPARMTNTAAASLSTLILENHSTHATPQAALQIDAVDDVDHFGIRISDPEGVGILVTRAGSTDLTKEAMSLIGAPLATGPLARFTMPATATTSPIRVDNAGDGSGVNIQSSAVAATAHGVNVNMNAATGGHSGVNVVVLSTTGIGVSVSSPFQGISVATTRNAALQPASSFVNTGVSQALSVSNLTASGIALNCSVSAAGAKAVRVTTGNVVDAVGIEVTNTAVPTNKTNAAVRIAVHGTENAAPATIPTIAPIYITNASGVSTDVTMYVEGATVLESLFVVGSKNFANPHPKNRSKALVYACLEGPENGIFWRTRGACDRSGRCVVNVPEHVTLAAREGEILDVLVSAHQRCAIGAYHDRENKVIVVEADIPGVVFSLMVLGERRYHEGMNPVQDWDWTMERDRDGSPAQRAYGPN